MTTAQRDREAPPGHRMIPGGELLTEVFDVTQGGQVVGRVEVCREGLYCRISCCCRRNDDEIHRLFAGGEKLGVLIPEGNELVLKTRVAAKRLKEGCGFSLDEKKGDFIPIRSGEPFYHLHEVRQGRLGVQNGVSGLVLDK